jgi:hypothetical protein
MPLLRGRLGAHLNQTARSSDENPSRETLSEIRHSMYCRSERWWWASLALVTVGILAAIAVISELIPEHSLAATLSTVVEIATPALAAAARWISGEYAGEGDTCRRLVLYHDAMGKPIDVAVARQVALWSRRPVSAATTNPYFASNRSLGPKRLLEDVGESAFFTGELARRTAIFGFISVGVFVTTPLLAWIVFSDVRSVVSKQASLVFGALAILTVGVLIAEVFVHALHYLRLAKESTEVSRRACDLALKPAPTEGDAYQLAEDYSIALARNLPIVNWLYEREKSRIESAYGHGLGAR